MKKRLLMVVPVLALLASCGETDPMEAVRKSLPEDVSVVDPAKEGESVVEEYIDDAFKEMLNISEIRSVYHLAADLSVSTSVVVENVTYGGNVRLKGDLYFGFETVTEEEKSYSSLFLDLDNFTLNSHLNLPDEVKEKMPIPEDIAFNDVSLFAYATELEDGTVAYFDLSNPVLQDYIKTELALTEMPEEQIETTLDSILGEKIEGSEYRPGLALVDVTKLLESINEARVAKGAQAMEEQEMLHPITAILTFAQEFVGQIETNMNEFVSEFLPYVSPIVGIKTTEISEGEEGLDKTSIAINVSSAQIAAALEIPPEYMPVNGVAGLLVSVGMDKGSEDYALEEISLSANVSGTIEEVSFAINGSVSLTATYNEQAEMKKINEEAISEYSDVSSYISSLIISLM
jgi:hypothetical protein